MIIMLHLEIQASILKLLSDPDGFTLGEMKDLEQMLKDGGYWVEA